MNDSNNKHFKDLRTLGENTEVSRVEFKILDILIKILTEMEITNSILEEHLKGRKVIK